MIDRELKGFRFQVVTSSGEPDGMPYRFPGRCRARVIWLNLMAGELAYTLKPVRFRE